MSKRTKEVDLKNDSIGKLFRFYLLSSIIGMVIKSLHIVLDGIFVGNGVAAEALAAVNIIMPLFSSVTAISMLIGVGGAALVSMKLGEGKGEEAEGIFYFSMIFLFIWGLLMAILVWPNAETVCRLLGANDAILQYTMDYAKMIIMFAPVFSVGMALSVFVRNDGDPKTSMYGMVASALVNILLNYIFIFPMDMGLTGAALATGIAQVVNVLILLSHFTRKKGNLKIVTKDVKFSKINMLKTFEIGFPSFLGEISFGVISFAFNRVLMDLGGELAVSAFSIMMYLTALMYMVFFGLGQAMQPIISFNYGAKAYDRVSATFKLALKYGIVLGVLFTSIGLIFVEELVMLFNSDSPELIALAVDANIYLFMTFALAAVSICIGTFFQAIGYAKISTIITILRGFVINLGLLFIFSKLFGLKGVWLVYPVGEIVSFIVGMLFMKFGQGIVEFGKKKNTRTA